MQDLNFKVYNVDNLKAFRQWMHQNAELSLVEFNTHQKIKEFGLHLGVPADAWKECAKTGWRVEIKGTGPAKGSKKTIAVRSDHDALPLIEKNEHLSYRTQTNASHMCGHDGHTACLLGGMALFMDNRDKIPSDRAAVFVFQPGEEGYGGADLMIKDGVMDGIDEIYGCHNMPRKGSKLKILVADKEMMAHFTIINIKIIGKGGHGSSPELCQNPIPIAAQAYLEIHKELSDYQKSVKDKLRFSLAAFNAGCAANVIPSVAEIKGTSRDFSKQDSDKMRAIIKDVLEKITKETNSSFELEFASPHVGAVINTPQNAGYVRELAKEMYGDDCVSDEGLPSYASEDFADFLEKAPGCFFFRTVTNLEEGTTLHSDKYNFDDDIIDDLSKFWFKIMHSRLNAD